MADFNQKVICLITDFGLKGQHYIASMKGVILKINSNIRIIDITHHITPYSIIEASYVLRTTYKYFPEGTVFIIVVDPGVGSPREILMLMTASNHYFIGPNNGVFSYISHSDILNCIEIQNNEFFNIPTSKTFHGRDIMAPVGAHLISGVPINKFGPNFDLNNLKESPLVYNIDIEKKKLRCSIQYIDSFGNGITNIAIVKNKIRNTELNINENTKISVDIRGKVYEGFFTSHFSSVPIETILFLVGSTSFLEISINQGSAAEKLGFKVGDIVTFKL